MANTFLPHLVPWKAGIEVEESVVRLVLEAQVQCHQKGTFWLDGHNESFLHGGDIHCDCEMVCTCVEAGGLGLHAGISPEHDLERETVNPPSLDAPF